MVVYHPLKITTDLGAFWATFYVEDDSGSKSATNEGHNILIFPESERDVEQQFVKKWKHTPDGDEFVYSYDITLKNNEDILVTDWYLFFKIKGGGYLDPDWLISEKSWVREGDYKTSVSNSLLMSAENTDKVISPHQNVNLRIYIIYKGESPDYESVDNLGFNYRVTLKNAENKNRFYRQ